MGAASSSLIVNAMTVDVEDYFQVSAFENLVSRDNWHLFEPRVQANTEAILSLLEEHGVSATFFVLGWVARQFPLLVRRIVDLGHELGSHGLSHIRITQQTPAQFRHDVCETKQLLEDLSGTPVVGYRAASFSVTKSTLWALDVLGEEDYTYSSSIYPIRHDLYGVRSAPRFPFRHNGSDGILEIPITTVQVGRARLPCGGGGYFRLFPYALSRWALSRVNREDKQPCVFYFHPWEIDADQPVMSGASPKTRFRHYTGLRRMKNRIDRVLSDFDWDRMDRVFVGESRRVT